MLTSVSPPVAVASVSAAEVARSGSRPWTTTRAPASSRPLASASPIPRLEPLTKATRPERSNRFTEPPLLGHCSWSAIRTELARDGDAAVAGVAEQLRQHGAHGTRNLLNTVRPEARQATVGELHF